MEHRGPKENPGEQQKSAIKQRKTNKKCSKSAKNLMKNNVLKTPRKNKKKCQKIFIF